jgi:hypothetical protein
MFSASALDGGEWSALRPGRTLAPGKGPPVTTGHETGWAPEPVWKQRLEEKYFRLCRGWNLNRPVVQPVARQLLRVNSVEYDSEYETERIRKEPAVICL